MEGDVGKLFFAGIGGHEEDIGRCRLQALTKT